MKYIALVLIFAQAYALPSLLPTADGTYPVYGQNRQYYTQYQPFASQYIQPQYQYSYQYQPYPTFYRPYPAYYPTFTRPAAGANQGAAPLFYNPNAEPTTSLEAILEKEKELDSRSVEMEAYLQDEYNKLVKKNVDETIATGKPAPIVIFNDFAKETMEKIKAEGRSPPSLAPERKAKLEADRQKLRQELEDYKKKIAASKAKGASPNQRFQSFVAQ